MAGAFNIYCDESCHLEDYQSNWDEYLEAIYQFFCQDFVTSKPNFEDERLPDLRRCERIRWPHPMIEAVKSKYVKCWKNKRKEEERIVIALEDFSYVVVLADRGEYILLWTAYCVEQEHRRQKLRREYYAFMNEKS